MTRQTSSPEFMLVKAKPKSWLLKSFVFLGVLWFGLATAWFVTHTLKKLNHLEACFVVAGQMILTQEAEISKLKVDVRKIRPVNVEKGTVYIIKDGELWMETKETNPGEAIRGGG